MILKPFYPAVSIFTNVRNRNVLRELIVHNSLNRSIQWIIRMITPLYCVYGLWINWIFFWMCRLRRWYQHQSVRWRRNDHVGRWDASAGRCRPPSSASSSLARPSPMTILISNWKCTKLAEKHVTPVRAHFSFFLFNWLFDF